MTTTAPDLAHDLAPAAPPAAPGLLKIARAGLAAGDADRLAADVSAAFSTGSLLSRLVVPAPAAEKSVVAVVLGLTARGGAVEAALDGLLRDADAAVVEAAEHALWTLWLRGRGGRGDAALARGLIAAAEGRVTTARRCFADAARRDPRLAEAHHQRGLLEAAAGDDPAAAAAFSAAVRVNPRHFGAWAGGGHVAAGAGRLREAARRYGIAASIHPTMAGLRGARDAVDRALLAAPSA